MSRRIGRNTHKGARTQLAKVIRAEILAYENEPTPPRARSIGYLFQVFSSYFKIEMDEEYKKEIDELRRLIGENNTRKFA